MRRVGNAKSRTTWKVKVYHSFYMPCIIKETTIMAMPNATLAIAILWIVPEKLPFSVLLILLETK